MKDKAIVGNIGHFDNEIDIAGLAKIDGIERIEVKPQVHEWKFKEGKSIIVLSEGRLLNLGNATGHPSFVMSNSFTNQTLAQIDLWTNQGKFDKNEVRVLSKELDEKVARLHLGALGATPDRADRGPGRLHRRQGRGSVQARPLPLLGPSHFGQLRTDELHRRSQIRASPLTARPVSRGPRGRCPCSARSASGSRRSGRSTGLDVAACLHVTAETASLVRTLRAGGAEAALCSANPLSAQDDVAAALAAEGTSVYAARGEDMDTYAEHVATVVGAGPNITLDDGADLLSFAHAAGSLDGLIGGTRGDRHRHPAPAPPGAPGHAGLPGAGRERGAVRAHAERPLRHRPVGARRHPARRQPAAGRQHAGPVRLRLRGPRHRPARPRRGRRGGGVRGPPAARAGGAHGGLRGHAVAGGRRARRPVRDRDRLAGGPARRALRAHEGRRRAGQRRPLRRRDRPATASRPLADGPPTKVLPLVERFQVGDRRLHLLASGRVVNLAAGEGHPAAVMDVSFALQALATEHLARHRGELEPRVLDVPRELDDEVARLKLAALDVEIDQSTEDQLAYWRSWSE